MASQIYSNLKLQQRQIRVVEILPGRWSEDIACALTVINLDEEAKYEALSYVWGIPKDTMAITLNGTVFQATRCLIAALRRLRSANAARTIWADAICINQDDMDERAQQVSIMQDIYSKASEVQVHLGESRVLSACSDEEQATWDDPPRDIWHRDGTMIMRSRGAAPVIVSTFW
jgi:Heterokaryon incompatibility protein (HET)